MTFTKLEKKLDEVNHIMELIRTDNPWIHQPFEKYEKMLIEELTGEL